MNTDQLQFVSTCLTSVREADVLFILLMVNSFGYPDISRPQITEVVASYLCNALLAYYTFSIS